MFKMLRLKKSKNKKYNPSLQPDKIMLSKDSTSFGRSSDFADVVLDSSLSPRMISRHHAEIYRSDDRFFIECNSLNGILVNSVKRTKCELQDGDVIVFGGAGAKTVDGSFVSSPQTLSELVYVFQSQPKIKNSAVNGAETKDGGSTVSAIDTNQINTNSVKDVKTFDSVPGCLIEDSPGEGPSHFKERTDTILIDSNDDAADANKSGNSKNNYLTYKDSSDSSMSLSGSNWDTIAHKRIKKRRAMPFDSDDDSSLTPVKKILKTDIKKEIKEKSTSGSNASATFLHDLNEELLCCICQELLVLTHALPCSHSFCYTCIRNWLREGVQDCPSCRSKASLANLMPVKVLDNMVEKVAEKVLNTEDLEERNTRIQELQDRINGRMDDDSELRAEYAIVSSDKEFCEKCNLAISNRLLRWVVTFPKTSSTACYHFKCFKPPSNVTFDQIKLASQLSRTDLVKVQRVVKK